MPANKSNVIEINGRLYDATTGLPVKQKAAPKKAQVIDGFSASKTSKTAHRKAATPKPQPKAHPQTASRRVHAGPKRAATLNRDVVSKPKLVVAQKAAKPKISHETEARLKRAKAVEKSPVISRFGAAASATAAPTVQPIAQPAPAPKVVATPAVRPPAPAPKLTPIKRASATPQDVKHELIREGLAKAESKPAAPEKKRFKRVRSSFAKRPKTITIAATAAVFLLLAGYVTYLNIPNMALRVAASRAGFDANMPGYNPSGFRFAGPVAYAPGQLTIQFKSNTDGREYKITEKQTNWDSESLLDNFVTDQTEMYQTYQEKGLTIYVYDGSNAAWVNGGVWYTIEGNSMLNTEQLIKIASSL